MSNGYNPRLYWQARAERGGPSFVGPGSDPERSRREGELFCQAIAAALGAQGWLRFRSILDFGCGSGRLTSFLTQRSFQYTGVDLSREAVRLAEGVYSDRRTRFIYLEEDRIPFPEASFDLVVASVVLQHIPDPEIGHWLREIHRTLEPSGRLLVIDETPQADHRYFPHMHPRSVGEIAELWGSPLDYSFPLDTGHTMMIFSRVPKRK